MLDGILSGEIYQVLDKAMNAAAMQQQMISNNIANVDTPGYKRSEVVFQSKLDALISGKDKTFLPLTVTDKNHIPLVKEMSLSTVEPEIITNTETSLRNDGNNVDIDSEMAKMAENTTYYASMAQLTSAKISTLLHVITDGKS
jgi:flagellar basal-body rod protein FlgB